MTGLLSGFKSLGKIALVAGGALVTTVLVSYVMGLIIDIVTTLPNIPTDINASLVSLGGVFATILDNIVTVAGVLATLIVVAIIVLVFKAVLGGDKPKRRQSQDEFSGL